MVDGGLSSAHEYSADPALAEAYSRAFVMGAFLGSLIMATEAGRQLAVLQQQSAHDREQSALDRLRSAHDQQHAAEMHWAATHDKLTGLYNLRGLEERYAEVGSNLTGVVALYIDINEQKAVNDLIGHSYGDEIIIETANMLRSDDVVARIGGDEFFALLLPNQQPAIEADCEIDVDDRRGKSLPPQQRGWFAKARILRDTKEMLGRHPRAARLGVRVAVGVAVGRPGMTIQQLKEEAEENMYIHKAELRGETNTQYRPQSVPAPQPRRAIDDLEDTVAIVRANQ